MRRVVSVMRPESLQQVLIFFQGAKFAPQTGQWAVWQLVWGE